MVKSTHLRERDDHAVLDALHFPATRCVLVEAQVAAGFMVVIKVPVHEAPEVALIENDDVVRELSA